LLVTARAGVPEELLAKKGKPMNTRCDRQVAATEVTPLDDRAATGDA
jgi:hypothetical protein